MLLIFAITEACVIEKEKLKALIHPIFFYGINKLVTEVSHVWVCLANKESANQ